MHHTRAGATIWTLAHGGAKATLSLSWPLRTQAAYPSLKTWCYPLTVLGLSWDGAAAATLTVTGLAIVRAGFTFQPISLRLTFGSTLPAAGAALAITVQTGGTQTVTQMVTRSVWASRKDYSGRDFSQVVEGGLITIRDTRYIVRSESGPWSAGDTFVR